MSDRFWEEEEQEGYQEEAPQEEYQEQENSFDGSDDVLNELMDEDDVATLETTSLRLEQAHLYQMLAKHNIFEGMDATPAAIRKVQQELKEFVLERLSVLLGMASERQKTPIDVQVKLPFNSLEVEILKDLAFKASKGRTSEFEDEIVEAEVVSKQATPAPVKKQGLKPLALSQKPKPVFNQKRPVSRPVQKRVASKQSEPPPLEQAPSEMSKEELKDRVLATEEKYRRKKATNPTAKPIISGDAALAMWATRQEQVRRANDSAGLGSAIASAIGAKAGVEVVDDSGDYTPGY
jgi:hypothetical protein